MIREAFNNVLFVLAIGSILIVLPTCQGNRQLMITADEEVLADFLLVQPAGISISPDGQLLLVKENERNGFRISVLERYSGRAIASNSSEHSQVSLTWHPESRSVTFQHVSGYERPFSVLDLATGLTKELKVQASQTALPAICWSPDGKQLACYQGDWNRGRLLVLEPERNTKPSVIVGSIACRSDFEWSPNSDQLAAVSDKDPVTIILASAQGKVRSSIKLAPDSEVRDLAWRPDSMGILATVRGDGDEYFKLVELDVASGSSALKSAADGDISRPMWLSDGRSYLYHLNSGGFGTVILCNGDSGGVRGLGPTNGILKINHLSPDGEKLYAHFAPLNGPPVLCEIEVKGGNTTTIYAPPAFDRLKGAAPHFITLRSDDGLTIPAYHWRALSQTNRTPAVIIMVHGGPHLQTYPTWNAFAHVLLKRGCDVIAVNYRGSSGYGRSFEAMDENGRSSDILAAWDYAVNVLKFSTERVFLFGESYGATLALDAATRIPVIGGLTLVAWSGRVANFGRFNHLRVSAFHGRMDSLSQAAVVRGSFQKMFGSLTGNRFYIFQDEGHHFFHVSSWATVCSEALTMMQLN